MANFIVVRCDSERNIVVVGKADDKKKAQSIMKEDFEEWFWQKAENSADASFEEVYAEYEGDECELTETSAWLNGCNHTNFDWAIIETVHDDVLSEPLSVKQIVMSTTEEDVYVHGKVFVNTNEMIDNNLDGFLDLLSERLVGNICLMDVNYKPVDVSSDGMIIMQVSGDVSEVVELTDEMFEELKSALFMAGTEALEDFTDMDLSAYDDKDVIDNILDEIASQMPDEEQVSYYRKYLFNVQQAEERIEELKKQIDYEKRKMECCAYGRSDFMYLNGLEEELAELKNRLEM